MKRYTLLCSAFCYATLENAGLESGVLCEEILFMDEQQKSPLLVPGIVMMGMILRIPFTSIPPVISDVAKGLGVTVCTKVWSKMGNREVVCYFCFVDGNWFIDANCVNAIAVLGDGVNRGRHCDVERVVA